MATLEERIAEPLCRWQCSDGCRHLAEVAPVNGKRRWRCTFFDTFPQPLGAGLRIVNMGDLTEKRILGPHRDEPTIECPHFAAR